MFQTLSNISWRTKLPQINNYFSSGKYIVCSRGRSAPVFLVGSDISQGKYLWRMEESYLVIISDKSLYREVFMAFCDASLTKIRF
jgi:hypothetical protein